MHAGRVGKICDFQSIARHILETVRDRVTNAMEVNRKSYVLYQAVTLLVIDANTRAINTEDLVF